MFFIYDDKPSKGGGINPNNFDPNVMYKKHMENWFYLNFIATRSNDFREKSQARKELEICERKQNYWKKHPMFDKDVASRDTDHVRKNWQNER